VIREGMTAMCSEPSAPCDFRGSHQCTHGGKGCVHVRWVKDAEVDRWVSLIGIAKCETCKWFWLEYKTEDYSYGRCRFNPPVLHGKAAGGQWPSVGSYDYCSKHEAIE